MGGITGPGMTHGKGKRAQGKSWARLLFTFCLFTFTFTLGACAIPQVPSRTVYEDPVNFVRLERDPSVTKETRRHSHPSVLSPDVMASILKGLTVQEHRTRIQKW